MRLTKALEQFGLNKKQAKIYLTVLELGSATVNSIARKSGIARSSCYDILNSLIEKGIASSFKKKNVRNFSVDDPRRILELTKEKAEVLEKVLPELNALYSSAKDRPSIRFYQGIEGMKQIFREILEDNVGEVLSFGSADDLLKTMGDYHLEFVKKRVKAKIMVRSILKKTEIGQARKKLGEQELRKVKFVPADFSYYGIMVIFGNKIALFSLKKDYVAILIESKEIKDVQQAMFEYIWQTAE
jgi:HTH-type transcriptional regulator, sugar sensing transcriptional regulator